MKHQYWHFEICFLHIKHKFNKGLSLLLFQIIFIASNISITHIIFEQRGNMYPLRS